MRQSVVVELNRQDSRVSAAAVTGRVSKLLV